MPSEELAPAASRPVLLRLRSSILGKVLGALVVVLVVSTAVTALVDARLTRSAVARQTTQVARSNLAVLQETFTERQKDLVRDLRGVAERLVEDGLTEPALRLQLIARLGLDAGRLLLDQLDVVDSRGRPLDPPVSVGHLTPILPLNRESERFTTEPTSRLIATTQGPFVQAVPVALGTGLDPLVLVGGLQFGDDLAFQLRRQLGGLANVILVADGRVAGSTLSTPVVTPPGLASTDAGAELPAEPRVARIDGVHSMVAYVAVGRSVEGPSAGALGIALPNPAAQLDRDLAARRLVAGSVLAILAVALGWVLFRGLTKPLVTLAGTAVRIAGGALDQPFVAQGSDEIARLARALEHMRAELQAKLALVEHQAAQLQESSQRVVAAQDEERRRLARDLHDGIQQQLVVLRLRLGLAHDAATAAARSGGNGEGDGNGEQARLAELAAELDHAIERLREVSHDLFPAILRDRGLAAAVRSYASRLPLASTLDVAPEPLPRLPAEVESGAYFLLCEAVTNALKHAHASELGIRIALEDGHLDVRVADDGDGFNVAAQGGQGGLLHMEDRVRSFRGKLRIDSQPGSGTTVVATFPVDPDVRWSGAGERTTPPPPDGSYLVPR